MPISHASIQAACVAPPESTHGLQIRAGDNRRLVVELLFSNLDTTWSWFDVTSYVTGWTYSLGAPHRGAPIGVGTGVLDLDNPDNVFSPWNDHDTLSFEGRGDQFAPGVTWRVAVHDTLGSWDAVATGMVEQWDDILDAGSIYGVPAVRLTLTDTWPDLNVPMTGLRDLTVVPSIVDAWTQALADFYPIHGAAPAAAPWYGPVSGDPNAATVTGSVNWTGTIAAALRMIAFSAGGDVYADAFGRIIFHGKNADGSSPLGWAPAATWPIPTAWNLRSLDLPADTVAARSNLDDVYTQARLTAADGSYNLRSTPVGGGTLVGKFRTRSETCIIAQTLTTPLINDMVANANEPLRLGSVQLDERNHLDELVAVDQLNRVVTVTHLGPLPTEVALEATGLVRHVRHRIAPEGHFLRWVADVRLDGGGDLHAIDHAGDLHTVDDAQLQTVDAADVRVPVRNLHA